MTRLSSHVARWKWCALAVTAITFLSLMPQIHFCILRGSQWHGAYATLQGDEFLYSAYINALIDGRPRRNDPFAGQDDHPDSPLPESLFSIQFVPPFIIAFMAKTCGASASMAFVVLLGTSGLLASLSLFWLLDSVIDDNRFAAVGTLIVICFGTIAGGQGIVKYLLESQAIFLGLPFLRRYLPSAPFPLFFVFCTLTWQALSAAAKRAVLARAVLAGTTLGVLIFSYFYLWTTAAAWFVCIVFLWLIMRRVDSRVVTRLCLVVGSLAIFALTLYVYLLSQLPAAASKSLGVLTLTHRPDLFRTPELIGTLVLVALIVAVRRKALMLSQPPVIFAISFAVMPFIVFNQQVITGWSMQPYHYEIFVANYAVLIGLVIIAKLLLKTLSGRTLLATAALCFLWSTIEISFPFQEVSSLDIKNDEMVPVLLRLKELANYDGTWVGLQSNGKTPALVFSPEIGITRLLPTWAPQGGLLEMGSVSFQSLPREQKKETLYMHLYYSGKNDAYLRELLNDRADDSFLAYYARTTLFGPERMLPFLSREFQPIKQDEIETEVRAYESFVNSFSLAEVLKRPITYAVTPAENMPDLTHLDLWYKRDAGERVGIYNLYRLELRK